ncbi:erythroferrone isoform X2 [Myotis daubentonii]|uniref:erythroferrone isoform X2 n=1 Tax=Myotis daubentonii TaxID=98922 RepID=UPI0028732344|nr:erythroferrone isoform X2 [Myotis daubentonii]
MAAAGARLLLFRAGLLVVAVAAAAAADLGSGDGGDGGDGWDAGAHPGNRDRPELPADTADHRMRRATTGLPESTTERTPSQDPWETWKAFLRHNMENAKARKNRGKGRKLEPCPRTFVLLNDSRPINSSELVKEFRRLLEELVPLRERLELGLAPEEAAGDRDRVPSLTEALAMSPPLVGDAFHCRLRQKLLVERRTLHELGGYYLVSPSLEGPRRGCVVGPGDPVCAPQPESEGAFYRGLGLNLTSGQYTAPVGGFYALAATLHVALPQQRKPEQQRPRDRLRLLICIESQCQNHTSCKLPSLRMTMPTFQLHLVTEGRGSSLCPPTQNRSRPRQMLAIPVEERNK